MAESDKDIPRLYPPLQAGRAQDTGELVKDSWGAAPAELCQLLAFGSCGRVFSKSLFIVPGEG